MNGFRNLNELEGRNMNQKKDNGSEPTTDLGAGTAIALLIALGMICVTVIGIFWIIFS